MKVVTSSESRIQEVRELLSLSGEELVSRSEGRLEVLTNLEELHKQFANSIAEEIEKNNRSNQKTKLILPVGPTGQYPILAKIINEKGIDLNDCYFFFMDEYCDENGLPLPKEHPLSFKGEVEEIFFENLEEEYQIPGDQVIFPTKNNLHDIPNMIEGLGGIDTCYGGIGIHGHVAFNEPEPKVKNTDPRLVYLNEYTVTINAIRANVGGDLVNFPKKALTIGMNQVLNSKRVRLYCRNDITNIDWANTVLRLAVLGNPGEDYPVTFLTDHENYKVITDKPTAQSPKHVL